jgi:hypothetical protein
VGGERLHPLYGPDHSDITATDLATERRMARAFHTEATSTNIHDHTEMIKTATGCTTGSAPSSPPWTLSGVRSGET